MQVKLAKRGPAMWFLGKPREIKYSLNFSNPGPVDINFEKLDIVEQKRVLIDLQNKIIETDAVWEDLHKIYTKNQNKKMAAEPPPGVKEYLEKQKVMKQETKELGQKDKKRREEGKFQERCDYLSKKSLRVIKSTTQDETDIRFVRALMKREEDKKKPRISVCEYLTERIRKIQQDLVVRINKQEGGISIPHKDDKFSFDVQEEDQKVINFVIDNSGENETITGEVIK